MNKVVRVVITGPECTGKSTLSVQLAQHYHTIYVAEYARDYIASLNRSYTYDDVVHIARVQIEQASKCTVNSNRIVFLDTYLIITKIWFEVVYGRYPSWIDEALHNDTIDLYLLCDTGIPWIADQVRENGGEMREMLFQKYLNEIKQLKSPYAIVSGTGILRLNNAIEAIDRFFPDIYMK